MSNNLRVKLMRRLSSSIYIVCFCTGSLFAAPQLRLSTNSIGPIVIENGANPSPVTINAFNLGDGSMSLSAAGSVSWVNATIGALTTCSVGPAPACLPIQVSLNTAGLALGSYTETLTVMDPNAIDSPQIVTVTVQVIGAPASAQFYVTPNQGASTAQSDTAALPVYTGAQVISTVNTSDNGQWLTFSLSGSGPVPSSYPYQLRVTSQVGQAEGTYTGTVILSGSLNPADDKTINVTAHVTSLPILQIPAVPITFNLGTGRRISDSQHRVSEHRIGQPDYHGRIGFVDRQLVERVRRQWHDSSANCQHLACSRQLLRHSYAGVECR